MRKAMTAAIVSIGILVGISGSASAQALEAFKAWLNFVQSQQEKGPPIGKPATPAPAASASGYWCIVGPPNAPRSARNMGAPFTPGSPCTNDGPFGRVWGTVY
jgi:hypothetical protein